MKKLLNFVYVFVIQYLSLTICLPLLHPTSIVAYGNQCPLSELLSLRLLLLTGGGNNLNLLFKYKNKYPAWRQYFDMIILLL